MAEDRAKPRQSIMFPWHIQGFEIALLNVKYRKKVPDGANHVRGEILNSLPAKKTQTSTTLPAETKVKHKW